MNYHLNRALALMLALAMLLTAFALADDVPVEIEGVTPNEIVLELGGEEPQDGQPTGGEGLVIEGEDPAPGDEGPGNPRSSAAHEDLDQAADRQ